MAHLAIVGAGATGTRVARQLAHSSPGIAITFLDDGTGTAEAAARALGPLARSDDYVPEDADIVVLATRAGSHGRLAARAARTASLIVSVSDAPTDVDDLLALDDRAKITGTKIVVGAGMMPGLTDILASYGRRWFDNVREVHVSKFGTGGPDCARQHHRALKGVCIDWRDGQWRRRAGGTGRELAWFPAPVQAADCYRAALADPKLILRHHPGVDRITSRMAATRRDRLTMHLPMLRKPHPEGLLGAVRVELRGVKDGSWSEVVLGCAERPAVAAGAVAAAAVAALAGPTAHSGEDGAKGLAEWVDSTALLNDLRERGLRHEIFVGANETY